MLDNKENEELEERIDELESALSSREGEEIYESMSEEERNKLDEILEQLEEGNIRFDELSSEDLKMFSDFLTPMAKKVIPKLQSCHIHRKQMQDARKELLELSRRKIKVISKLRRSRERYYKYCRDIQCY